MFRSILRTQNLKRGIQLNYKLKEVTTIYLTNSIYSSNETGCSVKSNKNLIDKLNNCNHSYDLFKLIRPLISDLNSDQLNYVYKKILSMTKNDRLLGKDKKQITRSTLLERSNELIDQLNSRCLINLFQILYHIDYDTKSEIVINTLQTLKSRLNDLKFEELVDCLEILHHYSTSTSKPTDQLFKFNYEFIVHSKNRILNENKFDYTDIDSMVTCFYIFLVTQNDPNCEVKRELAEQFLSPETKMNFNQSVELLKRIKMSSILSNENILSPYEKNKEIISRYEKQKLFSTVLIKLIDKCNEIIYELLKTSPTNKKLEYFLNRIHDKTVNINYEFQSFYDERLIKHLAYYLCSNYKNGNKHIVYNLFLNYSKFKVFDMRLNKFIYQLYHTDEEFRSIGDIKFYFALSKFRLPFVDHENLVSKMFAETSINFLKSIDHKVNRVKLLSELILNDVKNEDVFEFLDKLTDHLDNKFYVNITFNHYSKLALAKVYLKMFSELNNDLKSRIEHKIDLLIQGITTTNKRLTISSKFIRVNEKLQANGFLSNDLHINTFGIFDRSIGDLLPMTDYVDFFRKIDRIPLNEDQEL